MEQARLVAKASPQNGFRRAGAWLVALGGLACLASWLLWPAARFAPIDRSDGPPRSTSDGMRPRRAPPGEPAGSLATRCLERAARLSQQLGPSCQTIVRPPFVLAGDLSADELQGKWQGVIQPACEVLRARYFRRLPQRPVALLMFRTEAAYRQAAEQLFFDRHVSRFGYYKPGRQAVLVNLAAGDGPLLHELTHILMDADFPQAPPWLQEGLATLFEACELSEAADSKGASGQAEAALGKPAGGLRTQADLRCGDRLIPLANWRTAVLCQALRDERLPPLRTWIETAAFCGDSEAIDYAYARHWCWFLQQRNVLEQCYARLRERTTTVPPGGQTLLDLGIARDWESLEREFHTWLAKLEPLSDGPGAKQVSPQASGRG